MSTDPFRTTCSYNIDAKFEWAASVSTHTKRIVYNKWAFVLFTYRTDTFKVRNVETKATDSFVVANLGFIPKLGERGLKFVQVLPLIILH